LADEEDWELGEAHPYTMEDRLRDVMLPLMSQHNVPNPDMTLVGSLFWDERFIRMVRCAT